MQLIIAEKNEVAKAIIAHQYPSKRTDSYWTSLDGKTIIFAANGHMMRLCEPHEYDPELEKWSNDTIPFELSPYRKVPMKEKFKEFKVLESLIKRADVIIHAGDADDEGQIIVDEILHYTKFKGTVKRVYITDTESSTVKKAFANLIDNSTQLAVGLAAEAKSVLDLLFGLNLTRAYTLAGQKAGYDGVLYLGRVQTPVQALVVKRDREIESHVKSYYYNITALCNIDDIEFTARYAIDKNNDPVDDKGRISLAEFANKVSQTVRGKKVSVVSKETTQKQQAAPLPYNMATILSAASKKFKVFDLEKIDNALQDLRLKHNLITYSRSDCRYLSTAIYEVSPQILVSVAKNDKKLALAINKADVKQKGKVFNDSKATVHHGIIPTQTVADLSKLTQLERDLYILVSQSFVAQFLSNYKYDNTKLCLEIEKYNFEASSNRIVENGWKDVFSEDESAEKSEESDVDVEENNPLDKIMSKIGKCLESNVIDKETKPKKRYTVGTLIAKMNNIASEIADERIRNLLKSKDADNPDLHGSIGTSATQKIIVPEQFKKGMFIKDKNGYIKSTQVCRDLYDMLPEIMRNPDVTALWFEQQQMIADGKLSHQAFIDAGYKFIANEVNRIKAQGIKLNIKVHKCPQCESVLKKMKGKDGAFWSCTGYKDGCTAKFKDVKNKPVLVENTSKPTGDKCPECGKELIERKGKHGMFISCSGYPECKYMPEKANKEVVKTDTNCPKCGSAMVERTGKFGKFIACCNFPKCKYVQHKK